jgi:tRNA-2-methylthio-N6-dimethylallyladenosine synthase
MVVNVNKRFLIRSFGCQMNKLDSNLVVNSFVKEGFELTEDVGQADVVLVNTCSVRNHAEERVLSMLGHLKHVKKTNPHLIVAVFGCMAQRCKDDLLNHPVVNIVCGPMQIPELPKLVHNAVEKVKKQKAVSENIRHKPEAQSLASLDDFEQDFDSIEENLPSQAFVRVMHGCDNFCSYCIVPYVRGPEVSRPPEKIITQIKKLVDTGVKQVTLLGQTVNSYEYNGTTFADLLYDVSKIDGLEWIKFVTCYPRDFDERIFKALVDLPKVCRYLHIPAQSGSDRILKAMNRGYTAEQYLEIIYKAKEIVPDIAVAGDFIVGFPTETDEDFQKTVELVQKAKYKNSFIFKYSQRPGTRAEEKLADDVSNEVKKQRNNDLLAVQEAISAEINQAYIGKTLKVMVEGTSKKGHLDNANGKENPQLIGRSAGDYIVVFDGPEKLAGQIVDVEITRASALTLFGKIDTD